ncbi:phenylalanine 4-monooxygenase [Streptomyces sp. NPDC007851]|uniref:phenylalanine 4-monooxygenase n=1 Tax=Streptomyces sp. NPDC007851 TaxID=3155008 RepID=UPI0033D643A7
MFKEATLYSPVIKNEQGRVSVIFAKGHPGYQDRPYQEHRARIAKLALGHKPGDPAPDIPYTEAEHETWRMVSSELAAKHRVHACRDFLEAAALIDLRHDRLPQLSEVSAGIKPLTGFTLGPAAGLVAQRDFYGSLAERRFQATQYIRHPSLPRFSPEPDMIHEVVGHGTHLSSKRWATLYELIGQTVRRLESDEAVSLVSRVFWFTIEYGLVLEGGRTKVCGASLLSSCGELEYFLGAEIRPFDVAAMGRQKYLVEKYQPVLFRAESFDHFEDFLSTFLTTVDDDSALVAA